jgi:hypothetical protein
MALGPGSGVSRAWLVADSSGMTGGDDDAGPDAGPGRRWDVALSFAGTEPDYVGQVAAALKVRGVRCFYDADEQVRLWGTHLAEELPRIYAEESAAVVVFISADYAGAGWSGGPRWPGRWPRPGCTCSRPGSMTASCPGCCPTSSRSTCAGTPLPSSRTWSRRRWPGLRASRRAARGPGRDLRRGGC